MSAIEVAFEYCEDIMFLNMEDARAELAALRARVAELEQAVNEAGIIIDAVQCVDVETAVCEISVPSFTREHRSQWLHDACIYWLAAYPAPEPQP